MIGSIRTNRNWIKLFFNEGGENFTMDVPHHNKWVSIIQFLRKRGFKVGENPSYKKHYNCLTKYHKIGFKKGVACLMEIGRDSITVEFGDIKNLWTGIAQSFWSDPTDDRYAKLNYLEGIAVKLEIKRLIDFCITFDMEVEVNDDNLSPEEYIIHKLNENTHIHGKVTCLNDIKLAITEDSYNWISNSNDKHKKKIICGQTKYFYDWQTRRMFKGVVWHNINNMWWVIYGGQLRNVASFDLFDYDSSIPKRRQVTENYIKNLITRHEKSRNYKVCARIFENNKLLLTDAA